MNLIAEPARVGALGIDTVQALSIGQYGWIKSQGFSFVLRYLGSIMRGELDALLGVGLAFLPVSYSRAPGWVPTREEGLTDGSQMVNRLQALGIPKGVTSYTDLEGPGGDYHGVIDYTNACGSQILSAKYDSGLYVGAGTLVTSEELYGLNVDRYWHSCSAVRDRFGKACEPACGWSMIQLFPPEINLGEGIVVDINVVQQDYRGRVPTWCRATV